MATITNKEIIITSATLKNLDTTAEYYTYAQWQKRGYQVQKGQKAVMTIGLWTPTKASKKQIEEGATNNTRCFLKTSALFTIEQVKPIEQQELQQAIAV